MDQKHINTSGAAKSWFQTKKKVFGHNEAFLHRSLFKWSISCDAHGMNVGDVQIPVKELHIRLFIVFEVLFELTNTSVFQWKKMLVKNKTVSLCWGASNQKQQLMKCLIELFFLFISVLNTNSSSNTISMPINAKTMSWRVQKHCSVNRSARSCCRLDVRVCLCARTNVCQ